MVYLRKTLLSSYKFVKPRKLKTPKTLLKHFWMKPKSRNHTAASRRILFEKTKSLGCLQSILVPKRKTRNDYRSTVKPSIVTTQCKWSMGRAKEIWTGCSHSCEGWIDMNAVPQKLEYKISHTNQICKIHKEQMINVHGRIVCQSCVEKSWSSQMKIWKR